MKEREKLPGRRNGAKGTNTGNGHMEETEVMEAISQGVKPQSSSMFGASSLLSALSYQFKFTEAVSQAVKPRSPGIFALCWSSYTSFNIVGGQPSGKTAVSQNICPRRGHFKVDMSVQAVNQEARPRTPNNKNIVFSHGKITSKWPCRRSRRSAKRSNRDPLASFPCVS